jgi:SAM-dependent methyltransferase
MNCRVCDSEDLELVVDLGMQPWCNDFLKKEDVGKEPFYPLQLMYCNNCGTTQLSYTVKKEIMFGNHTYLSGITKSLSSHFENVANMVNDRFCAGKEHKSVLDIGSNDGTQLQHFKKLGFEIVGVESSTTTAAIAMENGINTVNEFFNHDLVKKLDKKFDIINAAGVFFHLEELHSVTDGIKAALKEDGVFVVQFLYMKRIVENLAFDQIYHEHLLYYTLKTIETLLNRHGLSMFDAYVDPIHGGSVIGFVTHTGKQPVSDRLAQLRHEEVVDKINEKATYFEFANRIKKMKEENLEYLNKAKQDGKRVFGMGAPVKGNTMLNYFGVDSNLIECLLEKNELRRGLFAPGSHLPILIEKEVSVLPDIYYVLAWNFKKEILERNKDLIEKGVEFYFPVNPKD